MKTEIITDEEDNDLQQQIWYLHERGWAYNFRYRQATETRKEKEANNYPHRIVMERKIGRKIASSELVLFENKNKLDVRRKNLFFGTKSDAKKRGKKVSYATSQYYGVYYRTRSKKWYAQFPQNGKRKHLGVFATEKEAAQAYNDYSFLVDGEKALLNVIGE